MNDKQNPNVVFINRSTKIILHSGTEVLHYHFCDVAVNEAQMLDFTGYQIKDSVSSHDQFYIDPKDNCLWRFVDNKQRPMPDKMYYGVQDALANGDVEAAKKVAGDDFTRYYDRVHVITNLNYSVSKFE